VDTWTGLTAPTVTVQRRREHAPVTKALVRPVARKHSRTVRFERISPPAPSLTIGGEFNLPKGVVIMSVTVIVRGIFAPRMFSPAWLLDRGLIGASEVGVANTEIVSNELSIIDFGWLRVQVMADSLQASTLDPGESERVRDFVVGVLSTLRTTPIAAMGINHEFHFAMPDEEAWHRIGDVLTPKAIWGDVLRLPGMLNIGIQGVRSDNFAGRIQIRVEPSMRVPLGVFTIYNDHYDLETVETQPLVRSGQPDMFMTVEPSSEKINIALDILNTSWAASVKSARQACDRIEKLSQEGTL